jgi:hypothetical protein
VTIPTYVGAPYTRFDTAGKEDLVDATPAGDHIKYLQSIGMKPVMIARAAGTSARTILGARNGDFKRLRRKVSDAILAVDGRPHPQQILILNVGCRRRLEALQYNGWSSQQLATHMGIGNGSRIREFMSAPVIKWDTHRRVQALFDELWDQDGGTLKSKKHAQRHGFVPALAWNDIDDPKDTPDIQGSPEPDKHVDEVLLRRILHGQHRGEIPKPERTAVLDYAVENGWSGAQVATILNLKKTTGDRALVRRRAKLRKEAA